MVHVLRGHSDPYKFLKSLILPIENVCLEMVLSSQECLLELFKITEFQLELSFSFTRYIRYFLVCVASFAQKPVLNFLICDFKSLKKIFNLLTLF